MHFNRGLQAYGIQRKRLSIQKLPEECAGRQHETEKDTALTGKLLNRFVNSKVS